MNLSHTNTAGVCAIVLKFQDSGDFFTDELTQVFQWLFYCAIGQVINVFGVGTNIINILCFIQQGFNDPVNISLLGLAISDIGCLTTLIWTNICVTPAFIAADLPFDSRDFQYLISGMPHATFTRITGCITAFITIERCVCITMPLKVKEIFTKRRVAAIIICMFLVLMASVSPIYVVNKLGMKYVPLRNTTLIGLIYGDNRQQVESVSYTINNVVIPGGTFLVIIVCTAVLVVHLDRATGWRKTSGFSEQAEKLSNRNKKIAKMVIMLSTLFICCFIPMSVTFLAMSLKPEFSLGGRYKNVLTVVASCDLILESVNSSANIFIYYIMSIKYRVAYRKICMGICLKCRKRDHIDIFNMGLTSKED